MIPPSQADISTVISIMPVTLSEEKPGLQPPYFTIPACMEPFKSCTTLLVYRSQFPVYIDSSRPPLIVPEPSDIVAAAICRDYKVAVSHFSPEVAEPGLFWVRGGYSADEVLTDKEIAPRLAKVRDMQKAWFTNIIAEADDLWGKYHMKIMISDLHRIAADCLGLERDWDIEQEVETHEKPIPCKFCRALIHPAAVICMHCRGVVNPEKFKKDYVTIENLAK